MGGVRPVGAAGLSRAIATGCVVINNGFLSLASATCLLLVPVPLLKLAPDLHLITEEPARAMARASEPLFLFAVAGCWLVADSVPLELSK